MLATPGKPVIAVSTGKVRYCSTSTGERLGALVSTTTWFGVVSGTASMGRLNMETTPPAATRMVIARTRNRYRRIASMGLPTLFLLLDFLFEENRFQVERALGGNCLPGRNTGRDLHQASHFHAQNHR